MTFRATGPISRGTIGALPRCQPRPARPTSAGRPRGRLTYTGDMNRWEFAIFKYSDERYDPDEWMFDGAGHLDGTVEGALKACMAAYP